MGAVSGGYRNILNPTNASGGYKMIFHLKQGASGNIGLTFGSKFRFSTSIPSITPSNNSGRADDIGVVYDQNDDKFDIVAVTYGLF